MNSASPSDETHGQRPGLVLHPSRVGMAELRRIIEARRAWSSTKMPSPRTGRCRPDVKASSVWTSNGVGVQAGIHSVGSPGNRRKMRESDPSVTNAVAASISGAR